MILISLLVKEENTSKLEYSVVDVKFYDYDRTNWSKLEPKTDNELTNEEEEAEKEDLLVEIDPNEVKMLELIWEL